MDKLKRYIIFLIGLFINSLGVSLITKAALGTSPISSIPYVLSLIFPISVSYWSCYSCLYSAESLRSSICCKYQSL